MGTETVLETLAVHLTAEDEFTKVVDQVERRVEVAAERMTVLGTQMSLSLTAPLVAIESFGTSAYASFNQSMTESTSIMSGVTDQLTRQLEDQAKRISKNATTGPAETARAYYYLASAGYDAVQSMRNLGIVQRFSAAGAFDLERATSLVADAQSAMGLKSQDAQRNMLGMLRVSDALVQAGNVSNASVEEFAVALTNRAGVALRNINKDLEEGVAALMVYADQGVKGMAGGDQLTMMLRAMSTAIKRASPEWQRLGIAVYDSSGKMKPLADIFEGLEKVLGRLSDEQKMKQLMKLGFMLQSTGAILPLVGASAKLREYEQSLRSAGGVTEDVANKQLKSFTNQMKMMWNQITIAAIDLGEILAPSMLRTKEIVGDLLTVWGNLDDQTKVYIVAIGGVVAALGPMLLISGTLLSVFGRMIAPISSIGGGLWSALVLPFTWLRSGLSATGGMAVSFGRQVGSVFSTVGRGALAAGTVLGQALVSGWNMARTGAVQFLSFLSTRLVEGVRSIPFGQIFARLPIQARIAGGELMYWLRRPLDYFAATAPVLYLRAMFAIETKTQAIVAAIQSRWGRMTDYLQTKWGLFSTSVRQRWDSISNAVLLRWDMAMARISARMAGVQSVLRNVADWTSSQFVNAWNRVPAGVRGAMSRIAPMFLQDMVRIRGYIGQAASFMTSAFQLAGTGAAYGIRAAFSTTFSAIQAGARVTGGALSAMGSFLSRSTDVFSLIISAGASLGGQIGSIASRFLPLTAILPVLTSIVGIMVSWPAIIGAVGVAWATLTESGQSFTSWVWGGLQPVWDAISHGIGGIKTALLRGDFGGAAKLALATVKSAFYSAMSGIMANWGSWIRNIVDVFMGGVKLIGEAWIKMYSGLASSMVNFAKNHPSFAKLLFGDATPKSGEELKNQQVNQLQQGIEHTIQLAQDAHWRLNTLQATGGSAEEIAKVEEELEGYNNGLTKMKEKLDLAKATSPDVFATGMWNDVTNSLNSGANVAMDQWQRRMDSAIASTTDWLNDIPDAASQADKELTEALKTEDLTNQTDAYATEFESYMDGMNSSMAEASKGAEDLSDQLSQPMVAKVGLDGANALEVGSAAAAQALQEYMLAAGKVPEVAKNAEEQMAKANKPSVQSTSMQTDAYARQFSNFMEGLANPDYTAQTNLYGSQFSRWMDAGGTYPQTDPRLVAIQEQRYANEYEAWVAQSGRNPGMNSAQTEAVKDAGPSWLGDDMVAEVVDPEIKTLLQQIANNTTKERTTTTVTIAKADL